MASSGMLLVSLMCRMAYSACPTRRHDVEKGSGTGRTKGEVEESDIIMTLPEPCAVGILFHVKAEEKDALADPVGGGVAGVATPPP